MYLIYEYVCLNQVFFSNLLTSGNAINDSGQIAGSANYFDGANVYQHAVLLTPVSAPVIVGQPQPGTVLAGSAQTFSVGVSGTPPLSYQWYVNGIAIAGATGATYTVTGAQLSDSGLYSVTVKSSEGTATSSAASLVVEYSHTATFADAWTASNPLPSSAATTGVAWSDGQFLAVAANGSVYSSTGGSTWTGVPLSGLSGNALNAVIALATYLQFVAVGANGGIDTFTHASDVPAAVMSGTSATLTALAQGNGRVVAVGGGGVATGCTLVSAFPGDAPASGYVVATTWTAETTATTANLNGICFGNGEFVAVGDGGAVETSPDGITWTAQNLGASTDLKAITYGDGGFAAVGDGGGIYMSPDGVVWSQRPDSLSDDLVAVAWQNGIYVAGSAAGEIAVSTDSGATWRTAVFALHGNLQAIGFGGPQAAFLAMGTQGSEAISSAVLGAGLADVSAQGWAGTGDTALIAGFSLSGPPTGDVLIRGVGPTLADFQVPGWLADPELTLTGAGGGILARNSGWDGGALFASIAKQVGAFSLNAGSADAAVAQILPAGNYTAEVNSLSGGSGIALAEVYDAGDGPLINLSARALVGVGGNGLTAGFVVSGNSPETVVLRAVGPTLAEFGVSDALAAPILTLFDSAGHPMQSNAGWGGGAALAEIFGEVGAFALPSGSADAAFVVTLAPGSYSAVVTGLNGTTGVVLAEIYAVP